MSADETTGQQFATKDDLAELGKTIATGITTGMTAMTRPKVTIGQYVAARRRKVKLDREMYQNNHRLNYDTLTDKEVVLLNRLTRPGRYINRRVDVIIKDENPDQVIVYIRYSDKTADQRFENGKHWRDFEELVNKLVVEQDVLNENEAEWKQARQKVSA